MNNLIEKLCFHGAWFVIGLCLTMTLDITPKWQVFNNVQQNHLKSIAL